MNIRKFVIISAVFSLTVLLAAPAMAVDGLGFGPRIGFASLNVKMDDLDKDDGAFFLGADVNYRFLDGLLGIRAELGWNRTSLFGVDIDTVPILASVTVYPFRNWFLAPYGIAGGGAYYVKASGKVLGHEVDASETTEGYHLGGGVEFSLGEHFVINADFRYIWMGDLKDLEGDANMMLFTAGPTFYF